MIIKVSKILGQQIFLRAEIIKLRDEILKLNDKEIILDFEGVSFLTRAAADELKKVINFLESKNYKIEIINLSGEPHKCFF
ncbi:hypothetical protein HRbin35_00239 [bacterium HR35]|nr:hypothetical protein HRbin35_00239 [bacterium HR35]